MFRFSRFAVRKGVGSNPTLVTKLLLFSRPGSIFAIDRGRGVLFGFVKRGRSAVFPHKLGRKLAQGQVFVSGGKLDKAPSILAATSLNQEWQCQLSVQDACQSPTPGLGSGPGGLSSLSQDSQGQLQGSLRPTDTKKSSNCQLSLLLVVHPCGCSFSYPFSSVCSCYCADEFHDGESQPWIWGVDYTVPRSRSVHTFASKRQYYKTGVCLMVHASFDSRAGVSGNPSPLSFLTPQIDHQRRP